MPIEVRRFGVGRRRPEGPPGSHGLTGQVIHSDGRGVVAELAFARGGAVAPHSSPNPTWFCVIEGGGWVAVGDEHRRVAAGDAVLWPAHISHAAWTDHAEMRAIVVEFAGADDEATPRTPDSTLGRLASGAARAVSRAEGRLAERSADARTADHSAGEPA